MSDVLVDTSVWVDHFRTGQAALTALLVTDRVVTHPWVVGELCCGTPPQRNRSLGDLQALRRVQAASLREVMDFVERHALFGLGCGLVDITLLASTLMTADTALWTLDTRLAALATRFGVAHMPAVA